MSKTYSITYNAYEYGHAGAASYQTARLVCTFTVPDSTDISSASASTPAITYSISLQLKKMVDGNYTYANTGTHDWRFYTGVKIYGGNNSLLATKDISTSYSSKAATLGTSWTTVKTVTGTLSASSFNTSTIFNSGNPSSATSTLYLSVTNCSVEVDDGTNTHYTTTEGAKVQNGAVFTLKAKPTFSATPLSKNTAGYYPDLTTVSTTISDSTAQFGGTISSSSLTIGSQVVTGSGDGTLSIALNASGLFTPTITVTDSRGITRTETLASINVAYSPPSVSVLVERINSSTFKPDEEGTNALITASFSYMYDVTTLKAPTVAVTDANGNTVAATVTWYSNYSRSSGFSNAVTWPVSTTNPTLYAKVVGTLATTDTYTISVTPKDGNDIAGTTISQTLSQAFFTIDFQAGGKEIAFGAPANDDLTLHPNGLFKCDMDAVFNGDVQMPGGGSGTSTPTADTVAKFDSSAKMNSTDMTSAEVDTFIDALAPSGGIRKLLWTNPSPSSSFAGQKISLDLTDYDYVEIEVKNLASSDYMVANTYRLKKGEVGLILVGAATNRERDITALDNTGITFSNGIIYNTYGGSQSTDNNRVIPIRIYGVKSI